ILYGVLFCFVSALGQQKFSVSSPDGKLKFSLKIVPEAISYDVDYKQQSLVRNSLLGFNFDSGEFGANLKTGKVQHGKIDETYKLIVGKVSTARNHCNEMIVPLQEKSSLGRLINLVVRAFNDGVA